MKEKVFAVMADVVEQVCAQRGADTVEALVICEAVFDQLFEKLQDKKPDFMGGHDMEEFNTLYYMLSDDPVDLLPIELQCRLTNEDAFRMAVEQNLLAVSKGRIVSKISKKVLLAYLLGRLFADDFPDSFRGHVSWGCGGEPFPSVELQRYFHVENLKQIRYNRLGKKAPKGYKLIDRLFVDE